MRAEAPRFGKRRKAILIGLALPAVAITGFFWNGERVSAKAMDLPFLRACEERWEGPNVHAEFTCQLSLAEVKDHVEAEMQSKAFLDKANQELKSKGWETKSGCYTFPYTAGHIEIQQNISSYIVTSDIHSNVFRQPLLVQIVMKRPQSVLREYLRDAKNSMQQRITGVKTDPSSMQCKGPTLRISYFYAPAPKGP